MSMTPPNLPATPIVKILPVREGGQSPRGKQEEGSRGLAKAAWGARARWVREAGQVTKAVGEQEKRRGPWSMRMRDLSLGEVGVRQDGGVGGTACRGRRVGAEAATRLLQATL